ncbi:MAG TPA: hypothetical protein VEA58_03790 [Anaerovoracaceae bacterium]|nr:hypothetical protein [Anaerovoracaceae bacterium]
MYKHSFKFIADDVTRLRALIEVVKSSKEWPRPDLQGILVICHKEIISLNKDEAIERLNEKLDMLVKQIAISLRLAEINNIKFFIKAIEAKWPDDLLRTHLSMHDCQPEVLKGSKEEVLAFFNTALKAELLKLSYQYLDFLIDERNPIRAVDPDSAWQAAIQTFLKEHLAGFDPQVYGGPKSDDLMDRLLRASNQYLSILIAPYTELIPTEKAPEWVYSVKGLLEEYLDAGPGMSAIPTKKLS